MATSRSTNHRRKPLSKKHSKNPGATSCCYRLQLLHSPAGYPHPEVQRPWWIHELRVPADNHTRGPHIHIDHQYIGVAASADPVAVPEHPFGWFTADELDGAEMLSDTLLLAKMIFPVINILNATQIDRAEQWRAMATAGLL